MGVQKNLSNAFVPVRESRRAVATLGALNAEVVLDLDGDANAKIVSVSNAFIGTLEFTVASDNGSSNFVPALAYPMASECVGGTLPVSSQPVLSDALVAANTLRTLVIPVGQTRRVRVRVSAYTSGNLVTSITADVNDAANRALIDAPATLTATATGAAAAAVTLTIPAVVGLRHVLDSVRVTRFAAALLTAGATPVLVTTSNLNGSPVLSLPAEALAAGAATEHPLDTGPRGLAATALNTATTIVCPATPNVIWRVQAVYRLAL